MKKSRVSFFTVAGIAMLMSCHSPRQSRKSEIDEQVSQHSAYDDSTLNRTQLPVLMPYNRIIDPAGKVVIWGDANNENHSLDLKLIPGTNFLAVEDRFGVAVIDPDKQTVIARWTYASDNKYKGLLSTYSGIQAVKIGEEIRLLWSAAGNKQSYVMQAVWADGKLSIKNSFAFLPEAPSPLALPNELAVNRENGTDYLYVVLNGNNRLVKLDLEKQTTIWSKLIGVAPYGLTLVAGSAYVTNWGGPPPADTLKETAGVPYGKVYINPQTGATSRGTVSVVSLQSGKVVKEIETGLHPNDIVHSKNNRFVYVSNGNSDYVTVIDTKSNSVVEDIPVTLESGNKGFIGDTPNALLLSEDDATLFVANGLDNAVAVVQLGSKSGGSGNSLVKGFIPTETYPAGLEMHGNTLFVTNLEGEGSRVNSKDIKKNGVVTEVGKTEGGSYNSHHQLATLSIITLPAEAELAAYTERVNKLNLVFRAQLARMLPRKNRAPVPVPERIGEPSVFKHVLYVIKENRTYDQVLGDMKEGDGRADLCVFGEQVTPNQHQLARDFLLMDNYYVAGKSSGEGHQWADAAMATDYIERNVQGWFRSYPHVQTDAMVYNKKGFIWNNAADHGKNVRIYGEACTPKFKKGTTWTQIYSDYQAGRPFVFNNVSTISRVRPLLSPTYPGFDSHEINDQLRASAFIKELNDYEKKPGDKLPELMVMALPADHTAGVRPGMPTPRAKVADNDLALGRIVEAVSKSRFWKNTVIFVTEDDSQAGWDHVSAYRTTGFVISPYSRMQQTVHTNYNQTCIVRTIEQILGLPPMNTIDATALPMFKCFVNRPSNFAYKALANQTPINDMNPGLSKLKGKNLYYAKLSLRPEFDHMDSGHDDMMNKIIWYSTKGLKAYPQKLAGKADDDDDD
jgi:YVTN family beta-propeller protein